MLKEIMILNAIKNGGKVAMTAPTKTKYLKKLVALDMVLRVGKTSGTSIVILPRGERLLSEWEAGNVQDCFKVLGYDNLSKEKKDVVKEAPKQESIAVAGTPTTRERELRSAKNNPERYYEYCDIVGFVSSEIISELKNRGVSDAKARSIVDGVILGSEEKYKNNGIIERKPIDIFLQML